MIADGFTFRPAFTHERDVFIWHPNITSVFPVDIFRIYYYTSCDGDAVREFEVRRRLSEIVYSAHGNYYQSCQLFPCVYLKNKKSQKSRLVDINITIEAMRLAYSDSVDVVCFAGGDGDFLALYQDIMRRGKQVCVAAFSSGLHPQVPVSVDRFFSLDPLVFMDSSPWQKKEESGLKKGPKASEMGSGQYSCDLPQEY